MAAALIVLFFLWITPIKVGVLFRFEGGRLWGEAGALIWGVRGRAPFAVRQGKIEVTLAGKTLRFPRKRARRSRKALARRLVRGRGILLRAVRFRRADVHAELGFESAAAAALLTGALRAASGLIPVLRLTVRPVMHGDFRLQALCIVESRLGNLCLAYALAAAARGQKEEKGWITPSAA